MCLEIGEGCDATDDQWCEGLRCQAAWNDIAVQCIVLP